MTNSATHPVPRLLRLPEVEILAGISRDAIYRHGRAGTFPRPIKLSTRASRWREDEIRAWLDARTAERDAMPQSRPAA